MVNDDDTSVRVAVRIRPQNAREKAQQCRICTSVTPGEPQVTIGSDKSFTFDFVFDQPTAQTTIYDTCTEKLVEGTFDGYNATVLAYGQTGSGKTYTMGTAYDAAGSLPECDLGIIPRAAQHIFNGIIERKLKAKEQGRVEPIFDITVQFVELYNEDIIDLLSDDRNHQANIKIGEKVENGEIYLKGVCSQIVKNPQDILNVLKNGALNRTTAATNMNQQSSRSHAIFTISIKQQRMAPVDMPMNENGEPATTPTESELEVLTAKFHFVDLAGSERLKRTGATGERAKEGISINCGLLALGNVISALGGAQGKVSHVPYRDSKLTRLLQDSLGGNSRTLMIACASPSDVDFVETLNTLNYANRAKNIKNKVVANQDKTSKIVGELRGRIAALEAELNEYKQGKRLIGEDGQETLNDQYHENIFLQSEVNRLRTRVKALQETAEVLRGRNVTLQIELSRLTSAGLVPSVGDENANPMNGETNDHDPIASTIRNYLEEIENLKSQLIEAHATSDELRKQLSKMRSQFGPITSNASSAFNSPSATAISNGNSGVGRFSTTTAVIKAAKEEIEKEKKKVIEAQITEMGGDEDSCSDRKYSELDDEATTVEDEMNEDEILDEDETMHEDEEEESEEENDTKERDRICNDLAFLQEEISIKEQLVMQLEQSEARLAQVRREYERKLAELSLRISSTEAERDKILADISAKSTNSKATEEKVKHVKEEYERKITTMKKEFSKLQALEREHERMRNQQSRQQNELRKYQQEITDMKRNKVELMKQLREENKRVKELERTAAKRLAGLEKESRQKDNKIRMLENRDRQREEFIKRKAEEYNTRLKQQNNGRPATGRNRTLNMANQNSTSRNQVNRTFTKTANTTFNVSQTPNRRGPLRDLINQSKVIPYSPIKAKKKWNAIEKGISRYIVQRQTIDTFTEEMNRQLAEREAIRQEIQKLENNFYEVPLPGIEERYVIQEELKSTTEKLRYVEDQIERLQKEIVEVEESNVKETNEDDELEPEKPNNLEDFVEQCDNLIEAKYLLKHLLDTTLEKSVEASKVATELKQWKAKAEQLEQEQKINGQLMSQLIGEDKNVANDVTEVIQARKGSSSSPEVKRSNNVLTTSLYSQKARSRRTATTEELLFPKRGHSMENLNEIPEGQLTRSVSPNDDSTSQTSGQDSMKKSTQSADIYHDEGDDDAFQAGASEEPVPAKQKRLDVDTRSGFSRHSQFRNTIASVTPSAKLRKYHSVAGLPAVGKNFASASINCEPSTSSSTTTTSQPIPINSSKMRDLLNRLLPQWNGENAGFSSKSGRKAEIVEISAQESSRYGGRKYLSKAFTMYGHAKPVISIAANDEVLITGSKDRTAKIWDLHTGTEKCVLKSHPNNVTAVKLVPNNPNMALTVSLSTVKVWDLRTPICVQHLNSSGITEEGENNDIPRQNSIPVYQQVIAAIDIDPTGKWLFTTFNCDVRYWSLENFTCFGKLAGTPRSEVSCMSMQQQSHGGLQIYTGHRDHSVKIYDMRPPFEISVPPTIELQPPHYDNVTCVLAYDDVLYTASKDGNIMKFWLNDYKRLNLTLTAHDNWINDMCIMKPLESGEPLLASVCKGGTIRLWDITSSKQSHTMRDEIKKAHDRGISAVCTNSQLMFTASTDDTVGIWKIASSW